MYIVAKLVDLIPSFEWLSFPEVVGNFAEAMSSQLSLANEGKQLDRFNSNFSNYKHVVFPKPQWPWVSDRVLVETFEEGVPMNHFLRQTTGIYHSRLAKTTITSFLKMVLQDNFIVPSQTPFSSF